MVGIFARAGHEAHMPFVQRTHGRHQRDAAAICLERRNSGAKRGNVTEYLHGRMASGKSLIRSIGRS